MLFSLLKLYNVFAKVLLLNSSIMIATLLSTSTGQSNS